MVATVNINRYFRKCCNCIYVYPVKNDTSTLQQKHYSYESTNQPLTAINMEHWFFEQHDTQIHTDHVLIQFYKKSAITLRHWNVSKYNILLKVLSDSNYLNIWLWIYGNKSTERIKLLFSSIQIKLIILLKKTTGPPCVVGFVTSIRGIQAPLLRAL